MFFTLYLTQSQALVNENSEIRQISLIASGATTGYLRPPTTRSLLSSQSSIFFTHCGRHPDFSRRSFPTIIRSAMEMLGGGSKRRQIRSFYLYHKHGWQKINCYLLRLHGVCHSLVNQSGHVFVHTCKSLHSLELDLKSSRRRANTAPEA